jgi:4-hydroxyphenylpyruvate dioxygenase
MVPSLDPDPTSDPHAGGRRGVDFVELWVDPTARAAEILQRAFGFTATSERVTDQERSVVLTSGSARVVVTEARRPESPVARAVERHGSGVGVLGVAATDVVAAYESAVARGAAPVRAPWSHEDAQGRIVQATVDCLPGTLLTFVDRSQSPGRFGPGFVEFTNRSEAARPLVDRVDHLAFVVPEGTRRGWVERCRSVLGFAELGSEEGELVTTATTAFRLSTVEDQPSGLLFAIAEPAPSPERGPAVEFLDMYGGPGVQHLAFGTADITGAVSTARERGGSFIPPPPSAYYVGARRDTGRDELPWDDLEALGVLVDGDAVGYLLQIFTPPVFERRTIFVEIIQRCGARGFGARNVRALYEAIEGRVDRSPVEGVRR